MYKADTIVARATAPGRGAVAIVRFSGPDCARIASAMFVPTHAGPLLPWCLRHGRVIDPSGGEPIDEGLAVSMPGPHSYTGEDVLEFHCHGSPLVVERILACALASGARGAERGEFTRRAVLNGKLDLVQAEAIADLIAADFSGGAAAAWAQLQGGLSRRLGEIRGALVAVLADIEANVDFSDDELPDEDPERRVTGLDAAAAAIESLLGGFAAARRHREGYRTVFVGRPNVGKSSLMNALLGSGRMIVTDEPGTTRDAVEESVDLGGLAFILTDTAGIRDTDSKAEATAVERARARARDGDLVVLVMDGASPVAEEDRSLASSLDPSRSIVVLNKSDLGLAVDPAAVSRISGGSTAVVETSALTGAGCDELAARMIALARASDGEEQPVAISRLRHRNALASCSGYLQSARDLVREGGRPEIAALELRAALAALASITDPVDNEEVLDLIFTEFCIGK